MSEPLVSIVITTHNAGRYLPETLDSALAQTHRPIEIIVVDDGSTDDTAARVEPYLSSIKFKRQEHGGLAAARNAGLEMAGGDYIALLDADDLWLPEKLAVQLEIARKAPESGMIVCDGVEFGGSTRPYLLTGTVADMLRRSQRGEVTGNFHREFIQHVHLRCPAQTLLPRRVVEAVGPFSDFDAQDFDYYLRVSLRFPITFHSHSLVRCRDRESSMSGPQRRRKLTWCRQRLRVLRAYQRRCEARYSEAVARQLVWNRAEAAFHYGELFRRRRALQALVLLLRLRPWPPTALPFLLALGTPKLARAGNRAWRLGVAFRRPGVDT